jgi:succinate-semialdehyde dehydrogenase/glutarate-semialdehyde dehydrogenase
MITVVNPTTGDTLQTYEEIAPEKAAHRLEQAHQAFQAWRRTNFFERASLME